MKNKQFAIGLTLGIAVMMCIAAAEYDLQKGVDLSAKTSVTASQLNQLVDNGTVAANKGMLIYSATTPDTTNNARYSRFIWLDTSFSPPVPKVYYTNGSYWTNITANTTIADNSVTAGKLAANSVYETNLTASSVTASKIADGVIGSSKYANASISNTHIASLTIQSTNIANGQILSTNIGAAAILGYHLASGQIGTANLTNGFLLQGTNIANGTIANNNIAASAIYPTNVAAAAGSANQVLRINSGGTAVEFGSPAVIRMTNTTAASTINTTPVTLTHGLGGTPTIFRAVVICTSTDGDFSVDDEIPIADVRGFGTGYRQLFLSYCNATTCFVKYSTGSADSFGYVLDTSTEAWHALDASKWKIKIYAGR